ncbi:hypothetical protein DMUE_2286 [Dictyocoela muelleri]|nr:hypothetical protein DMUE_2286 [Dictyocoela muelleri]
MFIEKVASSKNKILFLSKDAIIDAKTNQEILKVNNIIDILTTDDILIINCHSKVYIYNHNDKIKILLHNKPIHLNQKNFDKNDDILKNDDRNNDSLKNDDNSYLLKGPECKIAICNYIYIAIEGNIYTYDLKTYHLKEKLSLTTGIINDLQIIRSYLVCCTTKGKIFVYDCKKQQKTYLSVFGIFRFSGYSLSSICVNELKIDDKNDQKDNYKNCKDDNNDESDNFFSFFKLGNFLLINDIFYRNSLEYKSENNHENKKNNIEPDEIEMNEIDKNYSFDSIKTKNINSRVNDDSSDKIFRNSTDNINISVTTSDEYGNVYFLSYTIDGIEIKGKLKISNEKIKQIIEFHNMFYCISGNSLYKFDMRRKRELFVCGDLQNMYVIENSLFVLVSGSLVCVSNREYNFFDKIVFG